MTFSEMLKERGPLVRAVVSATVMAGYGVGTARAHIDPAIKAVANKIGELTPEWITLVGHGFTQGMDLGKQDENVRRADRLARKGKYWRAGKALFGMA